VVSDIRRLLELEPAWSDRVSRWKQSTPFQLPEWLLTWWEHFGSGDLHTLIAWQDGSIAGLVPCFRHTWQNARQLTLIGSGITDYLEPFIADECAESVISAISDFLISADCDVCDWQDLAATSPLLKLAQVDGLDVEATPDTICSEVELAGDFDQYWKNRSSEMRRNVRRYTEKAEKSGPVSFHLDHDANEDALNSLLSLHTARWQSRGESGMVEANNSAGFLRSAAAAFARRGVLRLFTLRWCERVVAAVLAFSWNGRLY
jgi:CelD/BcsL family acetyltransferase involved in cellulose biosynthesis